SKQPAPSPPSTLSLHDALPISAGMPIEAIEANETFTVPDAMVERGGNHYVLRVRGNSMIDEQIRDGDFVVVNERQRADNGEMVRSEEHTSELQSPYDLVCRLLL